ncbi:MAG: hypothetical protein ACRDQ7_10010 [Haloechinothrix sp.]
MFTEVRDESLRAVAEAAATTNTDDIRTRARASITAGLDVLIDDPRKGRVLFLEATCNDALQERRHADTLVVAQLLGQIFGLRP